MAGIQWRDNRLASILRSLVPAVLLARYRRFNLAKQRARNRRRTTEEVFTEIYERNVWGGSEGEFYSGLGTTNEQTLSAYAAMVSELAASEGFHGHTFVDLGCGDFRVGSRLKPLSSTYIGVDIVGPLIQRNQRSYGSTTTRFMHLDIVADDLPDGEVCFVRQVFQHLSNEQIATVLPKLKKFRWVFITEHYPTEDQAITPNIDKVHGGDVRLYDNSGVYLSEPPFDVPERCLTRVLEVAGAGMDEGDDPGVIRTFLYRPAD